MQSNLTHSLSFNPVWIWIQTGQAYIISLVIISFYHILLISYIQLFYKELMFDMENQKLLENEIIIYNENL